MLSAKKRGNTYRIEGVMSGRYVRLTLGTRDAAAAKTRVKEIELAIVDKDSKLWPQLAKYLPPSTFRFFADATGWQPPAAIPEIPAPTWTDLVRDFGARFHRQIAQGERSQSTWTRYKQTCDAFTVFLNQLGIVRLEGITRRTLEEFKAWKLEQILKKKHSRRGEGLRLDVAILHGVFAFAIEMDLVLRNPVKSDGTPGRKSEGGAQPFNSEELGRLRADAGKDLLAFLLLRHTALRGFDAVDLRWSEIDLRDRMLSRLTQKRRKQVWVPLHTELLFALEAEYAARQPRPTEHVLLNPETGKPMKRPRLYERMLALGRRAGVAKAHPHRFRDTLAVDMLLKGGTAYDVAKTLGDTVAVVEAHYAPYVKELRERTRRIMESPEGIEKAVPDCTVFAHPPATKGRVQ
jgi:integrase